MLIEIDKIIVITVNMLIEIDMIIILAKIERREGGEKMG